MADLFESAPDARQAEEEIKPTRFRPRYRQLTEEEKQLHDDIKAQAEIMEKLFELVKDNQPGRYKSLALTSLEESVMWIVKELTA